MSFCIAVPSKTGPWRAEKPSVTSFTFDGATVCVEVECEISDSYIDAEMSLDAFLSMLREALPCRGLRMVTAERMAELEAAEWRLSQLEK